MQKREEIAKNSNRKHIVNKPKKISKFKRIKNKKRKPQMPKQTRNKVGEC